MPRDHRNLTAFSLADDLALKVYGLTTRFEPTEHYGLRLQIRRAAVSVPTNIVEGAARESQTEFLRFLEIAFGSSREVVYLADLSRRLGFPGSCWRGPAHDRRQSRRRHARRAPPIVTQQVILPETQDSRPKTQDLRLKTQCSL